QPALKLFTGPLILAPPSARCATAAVSAPSPEEPPMTVEERTTKDARSPNEQDPHVVSGDCSLPLPQLETCRQVKAMLWLNPEDQVLADADVYDSDDDISDSSSLAGGRLCSFGGHGIGPYSCGGSGGSGSGTASSLRMTDTTCGSAPEASPPGIAHVSSVGPDTLQPSSALRGATSLVVNSAVVSYASPHPGDSSRMPSRQTRNCPVTAEAGQAREHTGSGGSGSSIAADCGGGGGGSSSSACGVSRVAPEGHAGTDAGCCASVLKQCVSDQDQLPPKRRCLEGGTAAPPSPIPSTALHEGGGTECRCACRKAPPSAREQLLQKQLPASPSSELEVPVGQGLATGSHDRHRDGMVVICRTSGAGAVQSGSPPSIGPRMWPEQGRPQPQLQLPPSRSADGGPVQLACQQEDHLARQPFSRGYIDPSCSTCNDFTAASYQVAAAPSWISHHPCVTSSLEHASAHHAQFQIPQPSLSSRVCGGGGTATVPALAPVAKVQQMPPVCLCPSCSPHSGMGTGCGSHLTATSCGTAVIPNTACLDTLGAFSRQEPAPSWASRHPLKDSTARVLAPATGPVSSVPVALAPPHVRAISPSTSTCPNGHWSGASSENPQSLACHCSLCAIKPRPLLSQRPPVSSYTPYHGVRVTQPFIDPNKSYGSGGAHTISGPTPCLPGRHAPEQSTGPVGQLSHYVPPDSRPMAHQPPRLFRLATSPGGPLHASQSPLECAPCGQKWMNIANGTPGPGRGHSHQLHHLPCSIKRELSLPEMPSVTSDGWADGGWKQSLHLRCEERSPSSGGAAVPQRQSSGVSSVGGAPVSRRQVHEPGPSCSSDATMGRGSAEVPSEAQRHQKQPLPGAEPAAEQQQQKKKGRISSGSSAYSDPAPESVSAPNLAAAAVGEQARVLPAPLHEAEREPPEAPAAAPNKGTGAASNEPQPPQQLLQQQQQLLQHQRQSQRQDQLQRQPSLQPPQVRLNTNSSERPYTCWEPQPYPWHVAQDRVGVSMELAPRQQRRGAHAGSGGAAHNALQAASLSRQARSDRNAVALATTNFPPQRDSPHHYVRRCLLPCTPLPSAVAAAAMVPVSSCRVAVAAGGCGANLSAAPGLPPAADSGRSSRVPATFEPTSSSSSVLIIEGSTAAQMTAALFTCRCPHCRSPADPVMQGPSWQTVARHPDVMKAPQDAAHYTIRSPQQAGAAPVAADRTHWSGVVLANK
ncbi:hypothetical protein VaNZ11_008925, partial [Volvox africanus]